MHSLRTRITLLTVCLIMIAVTVVTFLSVLFIRNKGTQETEQILLLLCETGEQNLDYYFDNVQKSVEKIRDYAESSLSGLEEEQLQENMDLVGPYFETIAYRTAGVLTYYYRIDPSVSDTVKGFWYTNLDGEGFEEHEVTDISLYDTEDTEQLVWFTGPKATGEGVWQPPYITDNLDVRVISYNVPIYHGGTFVGVAGIEIDYSTMAKQVDSIRLYNDGYAFLSDENGNLFYHPVIDVTQLTPDTMPAVPDGLVSEKTFLNYTFNGVKKIGAWLPLSNGMRLTVSVPSAVTEGNWKSLIIQIIVVSLIVLITLSIITMYYTGRITRSLQQLIKAAEKVDHGDYEFQLDYSNDDEVGQLTNTFMSLSYHMKEHINDLNKRVYIDALTSVKNKGAYESSLDDLQRQITENTETPKFAIGMFDCDDLKKINDRYGHEKGDIYLKAACRLICRVFKHSPVFRIGGDEFAVILQNEDYKYREELIRQFDAQQGENNAVVKEPWEEVHVSLGIAEYNPETDERVIDTVSRADKLMYTNKRKQKAAQQNSGAV